MAGVVVTGAAGHLGACLVRALQARGQEVRALVHRDRRALDGLDVEVSAADVTDPISLRRAFAYADIVYHTAAYISISMGESQKLHEINVLGTRNVVEACLRCGVRRLVHVSSIEALECEPLSTPVDESRPLIQGGSSAPYACSKAASERQVREGMDRGLDAVILYPTALIGPYDYRQGFPNAGLLAICEGRLWALVEGGFDWVDVRDVAEGILRAAERAPAGARYILSGHWASLHDLAELAHEVTGAPVPRLVFPMWIARIGAPFAAAACRLTGRRPLYTSAALIPLSGNRHISHVRATRELGYRPRPLRQSVVETLRWFENQGVLARSLPLPVAGGQMVDSPGGE
ncbi:MAG: NAD-dependent epimerase/dehydratase family protein [Anaerolineae bacterium]